MPSDDAVRRVLDEVWRSDAARIVATLAARTGDIGFAEDLAQEAVADALAQWPRTGVPAVPAAWLTTVAGRKAIDTWRRRSVQDDRYARLAADLRGEPDPVDERADPDRIDDDILRLVFVACHPVLAPEARVALTLRVVAGLSTVEIARALLVPVATVQQRIVRAKKTLRAARVPFEVPPRHDYPARLAAVFGVVYLLFNEGYSATGGDAWTRPDVAREAIRLGRILQRLVPSDPEAHALVALMELHASRFAARIAADGAAILLPDQDRSRWDADSIARGRAALARADALGRGRGPYALQAAIAECHAVAAIADDTDWSEIVVLYDALVELTHSPVVELNRAVAVSRETGPATALRLVDALADDGSLDGYGPLLAVRGDLLASLGRHGEARAAFAAAARLTANERERAILLARAEPGPDAGPDARPDDPTPTPRKADR